MELPPHLQPRTPPCLRSLSTHHHRSAHLDRCWPAAGANNGLSLLLHSSSLASTVIHARHPKQNLARHHDILSVICFACSAVQGAATVADGPLPSSSVHRVTGRVLWTIKVGSVSLLTFPV